MDPSRRCGTNKRVQWAKNKAFLTCLAVAVLYTVAGVFFLVRLDLLVAAANFFWAGLFLCLAVICRQITQATRARWWQSMLNCEAVLRPWLPWVGLVISSGFAVAAGFMLARGKMLFFWVNFFWVIALPVAGWMWKAWGIQRTAALGCLLAGMLFIMASVFWGQQLNLNRLVWFNVFWGVTFLVVGYAIDRIRNVTQESARHKNL